MNWKYHYFQIDSKDKGQRVLAAERYTRQNNMLMRLITWNHNFRDYRYRYAKNVHTIGQPKIPVFRFIFTMVNTHIKLNGVTSANACVGKQHTHSW